MPKPEKVSVAVASAIKNCANPGRSGHRPAALAAEAVFECREQTATLFSVDSPEKIIFTMNCTMALNMAIKGIMSRGGHAVIGGYEHNSVVRPLEKMRTRGVSYTVAQCPLFDRDAAVAAVKRAIRPDTKCVIISHVSNVFGFIMPIKEIDELCAQMKIPLIIDAAQSAGMININLTEYKALAFICMPGHKGLLGPQGTGILICRSELRLDTVMEGGTGSVSQSLLQPDFLPDRYESGTLNVPGIAGLCEGIKFVRHIGIEAIGAYEREFTRRIADGLKNINGLEVFADPSGTCQSGVLSFRHQKISPEELAEEYAKRNICVRAGLHCAPVAHKSAGTLQTGTVRVSPSWFSEPADADSFLAATANILREKA